jgi:branched-chain amino acid transport system substrate-binding protein
MKMKIPWIPVIFFCTSISLIGQEVQLIDSLFYRGINAYKNHQYSEAFQHLEFLDRVYPGHRRTTGSLLMQGMALYHLGKYQQAVEIYDQLIRSFPESNYIDDALYGKAKALYQLNVYEEAIRTLFSLLERGGDTRVLHRAATLSSDILDYRTDIPSLRRLLEVVPDERGQAVITIRLVQRLIKSGQYQQSKDLLDRFIEKFPHTVYRVEIEQKMRKVEEMARGSVKLGIILPLTGHLSEQGKAVLSGIKYATDKFNATGSTQVELVVRDSQSKTVAAIKAAQELCQDKDLIALIGELESDLTAAVAVVAQERGVPLIAPTASAQGITNIGNYIFQLSTPLEERARILAEYAINGLGLKRFAILSEAGEYGQTMSEAFKQRTEQLGGEILIAKQYYSGEADMREQFEVIRTFGISKMLADSILIRVSKSQLKTLAPKPGKIYVAQTIAELVDSTALSVSVFDGLFLPVLHEDLQFVIPQYATNNFDAKVFGGVPWNDAEQLEENRRFIDTSYLDRIVFLSDFYVDPSNARFNQFVTDYRLTVQRTPDKLDVFGYDAVSVILSLIGGGRPGRSAIVQNLLRIRNFPGLQGSISFGPNRVNTSIHIMQFRAGHILPIR